jgi:hypothetical protein
MSKIFNNIPLTLLLMVSMHSYSSHYLHKAESIIYNKSNSVLESEVLFKTRNNEARTMQKIGTGFEYTIEMKIPEGQGIFNTVQGNYGLNGGLTYSLVHASIYKDGVSIDGFIYRSTDGVRYKHMVLSGDIIKWVFSEVAVAIFINESLIFTITDTVDLSSFTNIGMAGSYNNLTTDDARGRRPVEYIRVYRN